MTSPMREVVLRAPWAGVSGRAFDDPAHGFRHPVDLPLGARRQHDALCDLLTRLGVVVHVLDEDGLGPDAVYVFDPLLVTDRGAIALRSGKPTRLGEEAALEAWTLRRGHSRPSAGSTAPATVDGGDTFWLRPDLLCVGRSLRTNRAGAGPAGHDRRRRDEIFDLPLLARAGRGAAPAQRDLAGDA